MNILSELEDVLREEQELLLSGDFSKLEALVNRKTRLADSLVKSRPRIDRDTYSQLAERATNNEALLDAARRGLRAALAQIRQSSQGDGQTTYSEKGERRPLSRSPSSVTQRV